ncbi:MAG: hypothetical protein DMF64_05710 [Acidobacteria bacterium]|nr:MAG: hypothetical protein DMF64_05710 [Acidobacteriota bacterium]
MKDLKRILLAALLLCTISAGTFADDQRDKHDPPPKDPKVIVKEPKPPNREQPRDQSRDKSKDDKKKPDF